MARTKTSLREDLRMLGSVVRLRTARDHTSKVRSIYSMYPPGHLLAEKSTYFNQGYWETGRETYDAAQQELARQLADAAGMRAGDVVLDCGFGYGDQDFFFMRSFEPKKIVGINITPEHVEFARARAVREGITAGHLEFREASATDMPFGEDTFDRVLALESAMHFNTRRTFFEEAFRVLRPGGRLATADIVPMPGVGPRTALRSHALRWLQSTVVDENWYDRDSYASELRAAGFTDVDVRSIQPKVWEPWRTYITTKLEEPSFKPTVSPLYYRVLRRVWADPELIRRELETVDYVLVNATKPL